MKTYRKLLSAWIIYPVLACLALFIIWISFTSPAGAGTLAVPEGVTPDIALVSFATGLNAPVDIENAGDSRLFVVEQAGIIRIVQNNGSVLGTPFLNITARVDDGGEQGLLGLAFDPDYSSNGYFYVNYTYCTMVSCPDFGDTPNLYTRISRFTVTGDPNVADPNSEVILMTVQQPYGNHNAGDLAFGPDGYLYIGMGDGGSGGDPGDRAQDGMELLGKMLRIDIDGGGNSPDCGSGPYTIPADNPFIGVANTCDEIWHFGLRNPWRFSFDRLNGDMYIGDVGQNTWEEIDFQTGSSNGGENWGWRCYEGLHPYNTSGCGAMGSYDLPITEYQHLGGNCSVTGGYVYRGSQFPVLYGHYIYADYCSGQTWTAINNGGWTVNDQGDLGGTFSSFGENTYGEIYLASLNGTIYHVTETTVFQTHTPVPTDVPPTSTPTPTVTPLINLEVVASGFNEPVDVENAGDERLFVAERRGVVFEVSTDGTVESPALLDIQSQVLSDYFEQGFLSIAFHPDFTNNGYLYTLYTDTIGDIIISRFTVSGTITSTLPLQPIDPNTELIILNIDHPGSSDENNGGELAFGLDGYLYISVGDGGIDDNGQDLQTLLGKVLRIDVNGTTANNPRGTPYAIPPDNPFVGNVNALDEIWMVGFRNPWRFSFDSQTGDLFLGDVGEGSREEIDLQPASSMGGENYGWSCYEGTLEGPGYNEIDCAETYVNPIHEYSHANGIAVVGGYVYRGCSYDDMVGKYYFADWGFGNLWSLESDGMGGYTVTTLLGSGSQFSSFGQGVDGALYILHYSDTNGVLYHLAGNQVGDCYYTDHLWLPIISK